jgi:hypothetical protein
MPDTDDTRYGQGEPKDLYQSSGGSYDQPGNAPSSAPGGTSKKSDDTPSREELGSAEREPTGGDGKQEPQNNPNDSALSRHANQVGRGYRHVLQKPSWFGQHRRAVLIAGGGAGLIILPIIFFLALLLPSLKLPQLAAEIEGYRLARLSRTFYKQSSILTADRAAFDAGVEGDTTALVGKTPLGKTFNTFRPTKVISNMKANGVLDFEYGKGVLGAQKLNAIIMNGERIEVPNYKYGSLSDLVNNYKERIRFSAQISGGVNEALDGSNYLVRSSVSKQLLSSYGISLQWWEKLGANYRGLKQAAADRQALRDAESKIDTPANDKLVTAPEQTAVDDGKQALKNCLANDPCTDELVKNNGLASSITDAINNGVSSATASGGLSKILSYTSPVYAIGLPVCLVYDGSAQASSTFLNSQNSAAIKTAFAVAISADQEKGGGTTAEAVAAMNRRIGDITDSIPAQIAKNGYADTSGEVSPQAGRTGDFTIFSALFGNSLVATYAGNIVKTVCPAITSIWVAGGLTIGNLFAAVFTGGESQAGEETASQTASDALKAVVQPLIQKFVTREGRASIRNTAQKYAVSAGKSAALTTGASYAARMIVLAEMGSFINGMDSNDFANQADMGFTAYGNQMTQQQQFGRPLTTTETKSVETEDRSYVALQNQSQGTYEKYFALSNPNSLFGNFAMQISSWKFSDLPNLFTHIPKLFATIFSPFSHLLIGHAAAATASDVNSDYNMVQFGWSTAEEKLINDDPSYDPLVNAKILADSGQAPSIAKAYAHCFGYLSDDQGNLTPDPNAQIGNLLTDGSIRRDSDGNVIDSGNCSSSNLGPNNNMVFRWRLNESYQNTLNELVGVQNVSG